MDCREAEELLRARALGEADGPGASALDKHLSACQACRRLADEYSQVVGRIENVGAPPPDDLAGLAAAAGRAELGRSRRRAGLRFSAAGLLAAAGLFGGILWARAVLAPRPVVCGCWRYVAGDPGNSRHVSDTVGASPGEIIWEQPVRGRPGSYKPLAWKELVVVNAAPERRTFRGGGRLTALDASGGQVRWTRDFAVGDFHKAKGFPDRCIADSQLYVTDGTRCLVLDLATGRDRRTLEAPDASVGWEYLTEHEGRLFGAGRDGRTIFALEASSGRQIWCRPLDGGAFVPALSEGMLIAANSRGDVMAFDADDGERVWLAEGAAPRGRTCVHAAPGRVLVVGEEGGVSALESRSGRPLWSRKVPGAFASGAAIGGETAYLLGGTLALNLSDGRTSWERALGEGRGCSPPALAGRRVLAAAGEEFGSLEMVAPGGRVIGSLSGAARRACDGPIVSDGTIYTVGGGRVRALVSRTQG